MGVELGRGVCLRGRVMIALRHTLARNRKRATHTRVHLDGWRNDRAKVVVTAQKLAEQLLDVPVPMAEIGANDLERKTELGIQDYCTQVPGLNISIRVT